MQTMQTNEHKHKQNISWLVNNIFLVLNVITRSEYCNHARKTGPRDSKNKHREQNANFSTLNSHQIKLSHHLEVLYFVIPLSSDASVGHSLFPFFSTCFVPLVVIMFIFVFQILIFIMIFILISLITISLLFTLSVPTTRGNVFYIQTNCTLWRRKVNDQKQNRTDLQNGPLAAGLISHCPTGVLLRDHINTNREVLTRIGMARWQSLSGLKLSPVLPTWFSREEKLKGSKQNNTALKN